ncbi:MAG: hypothetical protein HKO87_07970, partial [Acidimicrobiia bacterium]|nr:hypothetical protein [Acidimicrobiia bacterium]
MATTSGRRLVNAGDHNDEDERKRRAGAALWLLVGVALIVVLYIGAWLATRYDGDAGT